MATKKAERPWMIATIVLGALLLVSLLLNAVFATLWWTGGQGTTIGNNAAPTPTQAAPTQAAPTQAPTIGNDPTIGNKNAKVTVIEFSDFQCPFCGEWETNTYPTIKSKYIDTGKILFAYRDFPLTSLHPRALPAAIAAECVYENAGNTAFWKMHDLIFANQQSLTDANLRTWAIQAGMSGTAFDKCYADTNGSVKKTVMADEAAGQAAGVQGTPTFFVNGKKIVGAQPTSVFTSAIDQALSS